MQPIWRDDAPADARREGALNRLMAMCPKEYRMIVEPYVKIALSRSSDDEIAALLLDVEHVQSSAESGDFSAILPIARKYGATDDQIAAFLPKGILGPNATY